MKKRIVALSLCLVMLLGLIPADVGIVMHTQAADSSAQANYAANIGKTATFSAYAPSSIPVTDNPTTVTNIWGTDCQFLSLSSVPDDLLMVITNYYLAADGNLWYKVKAADEVIVVENAPLGVTAGVAAGLFTVAANTGPLKDEVLSQAGANLVFPSIEALCNEWEKLFSAING